MHGGGAFVWPLIQDYAYISLTPITINIPLENALSLQNIRINVPSTFTVGVSTAPEIMSNAAERILHLQQTAIEEMAKEIIFGQLRLTVASLTIEQINQDRESFLDSIRRNVEPELNKIGLQLINVNITDITDASEYISSIGKKAASEAINQAKIDVAEQSRHGAIGEANAIREQEIKIWTLHLKSHSRRFPYSPSASSLGNGSRNSTWHFKAKAVRRSHRSSRPRATIATCTLSRGPSRRVRVRTRLPRC